MKFDDIVKRESINHELGKEYNMVQLELDMLARTYYNETIISSLKFKMKEKLFTEFREYFKNLGFILTNKDDLYGIKTIVATIGKYKVEISINDSYDIFLNIQHKNDFTKEEYTLSMDISSENQFDSCIKNGYSYNKDELIKLMKEDRKLLSQLIEENKSLEVVCKFNDGQNLNMSKEYRAFEDIIEYIPDK